MPMLSRARRPRPHHVAFLAVILLASLVGATLVRSDDAFDEEPIRYGARTPHDSVASLQERLDRGEIQLKREPGHGYLKSVLWALGIPSSSQMLVFSKTSVQRDRISPATPRALYFNEETYVGWVQDGEVLEVVSLDPQLGAIFYTLDQEGDAQPRFRRRTYDCLQCHANGRTLEVPGPVMRSVFPDVTGEPIQPAGSFVTTDESPMKERWGGWYVTGYHGRQQHLGNLTFRDVPDTEKPNLAAGANLPDLRGRISTAPYLTPYSDIVALMVAEHQVRLQNLITRANQETRRALQYEKALARDLGHPEGEHLDSTRSRVRSVCEPLVRGLLFANAAPLTAPVTCTSGFARTFQKGGPQDRLGRSLRELDLRKRLFRYPCSYLVYSPEFDGLPELARTYVYRRLAEVLQEKEVGREFGALTPADRLALREILRDTRPEFAAALQAIE